MTNERTPLLSVQGRSINKQTLLITQELLRSDVLTNIFHERCFKRQKMAIVFMVSYVGVLSSFALGSLLPLVKSITEELNTRPEVVNRAVSVALFASATGSIIGASFSSFYGRRPAYLFGLPIQMLGSLCVAMSKNSKELMAGMFLQAIGASSRLSVGVAVIGDVYRIEERGTAMGFLFAACSLGSMVAPVVGGFVAHYASWRAMQFSLGVAGLLGFLLLGLFLPETSLPGARGIDKRGAEPGQNTTALIIPKPFSAIALLLRSPNIVAMSLVSWTVVMTDYVMRIPIPYTIQRQASRYGIVDPATIGLLYLPLGLGSFREIQQSLKFSHPLAAPFAGWLSDRVVKKMSRKRGGVWYPEDRLRPALLGAGLVAPLSVLGVGVVTHYVQGPLGLILSVICLFLNGSGLDMVFGPSAAYVVDITLSRSAESMASYRGFRDLLVSISVVAIAPAIDRFGILWTNAISALIAWAGFGLLCIVIRYGEKMRNRAGRGCSSAETN
ncbi:MFS general substrate transporter [Marasmius fiardii PR-910]|nr:MFS general substrate transporter [Marasmius fiardii PR-910]